MHEIKKLFLEKENTPLHSFLFNVIVYKDSFLQKILGSSYRKLAMQSVNFGT